MEFKSIFDFLKDDEQFEESYKKCIEMEKSIINQSDYSPFILGRSASEAIIRVIAKNNPELNNRFFKYDDDFVSFNDLIFACKEKDLISGNDFKKYRQLQKWGNATIHPDNDFNFLNEYKKDHRYLFDISKHCYQKFHDDEIIYEYNLDDYDFKIETDEEERNHQIKNVRFNEVAADNLIESFELKNIFIPKIFINSIINSFEDNIINKNQFKSDIKDTEFINDENLDIFLNYFNESVQADVKKSIQDLNDNLSKDILESINELNKSELSFKELNSLIENSKDSNQRQIYTYIKALADDLVKSQINEYKKEVENSPITKFAENGRKLLNYKNYKIVEDDFGFSLEEFGKNIFLDDDQQKAVEYDGDKPLVINAGPGSGKTRVIIERVVHLIKKGIDPSTILVITFTRKATQELKDRLINETELDVKDINKMRISTVHGSCRYLIAKYEPVPYNYLTRHGERSLFFKKHKFDLGFKKYAFLYDYWIPSVLEEYDKYFSFKIDSEELVNFIKNTISPYETHYNSPNNRYKRYIDDFYQNNDINECPNRKILDSKKLFTPSYYYRWLNVAESYHEFLKIMNESSTCDDNTVLTKANRILRNEYVLNRLPYKNILIDEFQDTDHSQKRIFEKLLKISDSFTIVGDADQSIYGWRGAYPEFFESFSKRDVENVTLSTNYRSSRNIVEFNEELIKKTRSNPKELKSKKKYHAPIYHMTNKTVDDEANRIVSLINNLMNQKKIKYYSDVAVLFRRNKSVDALIKPLEMAGIEYHLKENKDFLDQNEIKAMLLLFWYVMPYDKFKLNHLGDSFLNLSGFKDSDEFTSNHIFRLSNDTQDKLFKTEKDYQHDLKNVARAASRKIKGYSNLYSYAEVFDLEDKVKNEIFDNIETFDIGLLDKEGLIEFGIINENDLNFFLKLNHIKERLFSNSYDGKKITTLELFYELLNITDYFSEISIDNNPDDLKIKDNLALLSHIIKDYESIMGEYDYIGLFVYLNRVLKGYSCRQNELDEGFNKVHLLSMHSAKGLEYPVVILGSLKDGICPLRYDSKKELYSTPNYCFEYIYDESTERQKYDAEELRTIYVASTRAKEILVLSSIGRDSKDVPDFLGKLKENPDVKIKLLEPGNTSIIPKIESSKVFKFKNDFPKVKFEDIIDDFIFCEYRYDLANNTRFKVKLRNDKYVDMVLHKLLYGIHSSESIDLDLIDKKIDTIINYHNISSSNSAYDIINNVKDYWIDWGNDYKIVDYNVKVLSRLKFCDLNSLVDLVIEEDNKISVVHFIGSDSNIYNMDLYKGFLLFYVTVLKDFDEFKDKEFNKVYLHSLKNNKRHEIKYDETMESYVLEYLDEFTKTIHDNKFIKRRDNCSNCEYYGSVCKG